MNIRMQKAKNKRTKFSGNISGGQKQIYSYYQADQPGRVGRPDDKRIKYGQKQKLIKRLRLVPTLLAIVVIMFSVAYSTTLSSDPIVKLVGDSQQYRTNGEYEQKMSDILRSSILNKNKLTLNARAQEDKLLTAFPELDAVTVSVPVIGRRPTVHIHTRTPALIISSGSSSYVVDIYGVVIGKSNEVASNILDQLLVATDKSNLQIESGRQALTSDCVNFILGIKAELDNKQLAITGLDLVAGGYEVDFHIKDQSYFLKTDSSGDARIQAGDYLAARNSGIEPKEYMDVRVEEKVFYK